MGKWIAFKCNDCKTKWKFLRFKGGQDPQKCLRCNSTNIVRIPPKEVK